ncbi:MAG TPA: Uma2 family endonuclease [Bryobacteraceae bacterium]|nr:Uma2 family endonuclease [Bryobacteraceae bacterium]
MSTRTLISVADFDRLIEPDELRYELDEGELIEMVRPRYNPHNRIVRVIDRALLAYVDRNPIGEVLSTDNLFVLGPTTKRAPDLAFLTNERMRQIETGKDIEGAPDLAIEVLSPSDKAAAIRRKVKQYFAAGSKVVWLVYPQTREVEAWESEAGPARVLGDRDTLEAPGLLPGFSLEISSLF